MAARGFSVLAPEEAPSDDYRCALRDVTGAGRCHGPLTFHHRRKAGQGGAYSADNGATLCRHHNQLIESRADVATIAERLGLVVRRRPPVDPIEAEDRRRHRGDRIRTTAELSHPTATLGEAS